MKSQSFMKHSVWFPQGVTVAISILTKMLACWRQRLSPLDSKRTQHVTMKWLCQLKGWGKKTNPHWFDFHGPPTPFPMIDPGLVPIQKDNKNTNQSSHSYWGARAPETILLQMRRNREKKKEREKRGWTISLSRVILDPRVSQDSFVLLRWGEVQLHGLVDFPVLLAHQLQGEGAVQDLWGEKGHCHTEEMYVWHVYKNRSPMVFRVFMWCIACISVHHQ